MKPLNEEGVAIHEVGDGQHSGFDLLIRSGRNFWVAS